MNRGDMFGKREIKPSVDIGLTTTYNFGCATCPNKKEIRTPGSIVGGTLRIHDMPFRMIIEGDVLFTDGLESPEIKSPERMTITDMRFNQDCLPDGSQCPHEARIARIYDAFATHPILLHAQVELAGDDLGA